MPGHSLISNLKQKDDMRHDDQPAGLWSTKDKSKEALMKKLPLHSNPYCDRV